MRQACVERVNKRGEGRRGEKGKGVEEEEGKGLREGWRSYRHCGGKSFCNNTISKTDNKIIYTI